MPSLAQEGRLNEAETALRQYVEWFGTCNVYVEPQQNLVQGDTQRSRSMADLTRKLGVGTVATTNVHYHVRERHQLHDALVAV